MNFELETDRQSQELWSLTDTETVCQKKHMLPLSNEFHGVNPAFEFTPSYWCTRLPYIRFTQPGFFEKMQIAMGHAPTYCWTDADREGFMRVWPKIEYAFQKSYENSLAITAADALVILLDRFTFNQIESMADWVLARLLQANWKDLYQLSVTNESTTERNNVLNILQTA